MKFSMNGFRRGLSDDAQSLRDVAECILNDGLDYNRDDLVEAVNRIITQSNVLNCVYVADDPEFTDLGHLEVEHLEDEGRA